MNNSVKIYITKFKYSAVLFSFPMVVFVFCTFIPALHTNLIQILNPDPDRTFQF